MIMNGVFPVYNMTFKIGSKGLASAEADMVSVKDMESFSIAMENGTENWTPLDLSLIHI